MDNAEEILQALEEFTKLKPKEIPKELDEYLGYVAKTGDPVYQWHLVKHLFHEKLLSVITEFYETSPTIDLPPCPNVDPFNYERMKTSLLERLDTFTSAPFTIQRICELLTNPRKQYNRVDKFMRAVEKNILVVSTREPGAGKRLETDQTEAVLNGIPDSKINENDDRIVNVCSDNLQYNSTDSSEVPVENAVNACIIQEQIEIDNSALSTGVSGETKSWCESSDISDKKDSDNVNKTDNLVDNVEINVVSTSTSITNTELPKSDSLFTENASEIKQNQMDKIEESSTDNIICSEPIVSSTPDSPDSPEPSNSDETCEPSNDENNTMKIAPDDTENEHNITCENETNVQQSQENISDIVEEEERKLADAENADEVIESTINSINAETPSQIPEEMLNVESSTVSNINVDETPQISDEMLNVESTINSINVETPQMSEEMLNISSQEVQQQEKEETVNELKIEQLSPENVQQPDSSNDSCQSGGGDGDSNSQESGMNVKIESITQIEDTVGNNSELSSEQNISSEIPDVTSSQASITIQEEDEEAVFGGGEENTNEDIIVKEVTEEDEETGDSQKLEELKESVELPEESVVIATNEETVVSSDECVSIEEISEIKDDDGSNTDTGIVESSNEILDELCEPERREGSIIHATPNVGTERSTVEDICVDQSSCGAEEEEAMDVDETSNQQMITSEGETEGEPMDQSEHLQS